LHETTENPCVASSILAWTTIFSAEQALFEGLFCLFFSFY